MLPALETVETQEETQRMHFMKRFVLAFVLATFTACTGGGTDPKTQCPSDPNKQLSRAEWKACYGYQDHDASGPGK